MRSRFAFRLLARSPGSAVGLAICLAAAAGAQTPAPTKTGARPDAIRLGAPSALSATSTQACQVALTWNDEAQSETAYIVERRQGAAAFALVATLPADATGHVDGSVEASASYDYRVRAVQGTKSSAPSNVASVTTAPNALPALRADLAIDARVLVGQVLEFGVTATDPEGQPVSIALMNPPPGLVFDPVTSVASPATVPVRWLVSAADGRGLRELVFEARDDCDPQQRSRLIVRVQVEGAISGPRLLSADVTGDGVLDVIGGASAATVSGVFLTGAAYVWAGATVPLGAPTANLLVPGALPGDALGSNQGIVLGDVTGDGTLDLVIGSRFADVAGVIDAGAIYVWKGGATLTHAVAPIATLTVPGALVLDRLGTGAGQAIQLADVSGDGVLDIVAGSHEADAGGIPDAGGLYVWNGGASLSGAISPSATMRIPGAVAGDALGFADDQGVRLADVSGDGIVDVVACAATEDFGGVSNAGAVHVFFGGATLTGNVLPTANLGLATPVADDLLGLGSGLQLGDVTGDGTLDIVVTASQADVVGVVDAGSVQVFAGGATLVGDLAPLATLANPAAVAGDGLGHLSIGRGVELADLTSDGVLDIVVAAERADVAGVIDAGLVLVWRGGAGLTGAPAPSATLSVPGAQSFDQLGFVQSGEGLVFGEVTGDASIDLIVGAVFADVGFAPDAGAVYVWRGGATLAGNLSPHARLADPLAFPGDSLCFSIGQGLKLADVSGDGTRDLVVAARNADVGGVIETGCVHVWFGGSALSGSLAPTATCVVPGATAFDLVCNVPGQGLTIADVTGDALSDVIAGANVADANGIADSGAVYVWAGSPTLAGVTNPSAVFSVASSATGDGLGTLAGVGIQAVDVTGDGVLDLVTGANSADVGGVANVGAIYVRVGGASFTGAVGPSAILSVPGAVDGDQLGSIASTQGVQLGDVTGDGVLDVYVGAAFADIAGVVNCGAIYLWKGPISASSAPTRALTVPSASFNDRLGN